MRRSVDSLELVAHRLRELRKARSLSQQEVAEGVGIPQSNLSRIENGKQRLTLSMLTSILKFYRISLDDFFSGADSARPVDSREERLLQIFRALDETGRQEVEDYLEFKSARQAETRREEEEDLFGR